MLIQIFYPVRAGRVTLRTDKDWNARIEPDSISADRTIHRFRVDSAQPFFYFKPCIEDQEAITWSRGTNFLAVLQDTPRNVYPHFFSSLGGRVTDPMEVSDPHTRHKHLVRLYLPGGYDENPLKRYPVLYMHDGRNVFFDDEAFTGTAWRTDVMLQRLDAMNVIGKVIVVAVYPEDREREYTQPGYRTYGRFLVETLRSQVDANFRTLSEPRHTAVMGASLGGVVSFYLAWEYPEVFGMAACMSSTFGYRDDLLARVQQETPRPVRFYLDSGWPGDNFEMTVTMRDVLLSRGYEVGHDLLYFSFPLEQHSEGYWGARSHLPFQFFFDTLPATLHKHHAKRSSV